MKPFVILLHQRMRTPQNSSKCLNPTRAVIPRVESPQQLVSLSDVILERTLLASLPIHRRPWVLLYSTRVFISTPRTTWKRTTWEYYRKLKALRQYALFGLKRHPTAWMLNMSLSRTVGVTSLWRTTHVGSRWITLKWRWNDVGMTLESRLKRTCLKANQFLTKNYRGDNPLHMLQLSCRLHLMAPKSRFARYKGIANEEVPQLS